MEYSVEADVRNSDTRVGRHPYHLRVLPYSSVVYRGNSYIVVVVVTDTETICLV
jgi:hypothetical protein